MLVLAVDGQVVAVVELSMAELARLHEKTCPGGADACPCARRGYDLGYEEGQSAPRKPPGY
jgi:hypothetical protein